MMPKRLLLAKTGLDCHDTGIVTVAQKLRVPQIRMPRSYCPARMACATRSEMFA